MSTNFLWGGGRVRLELMDGGQEKKSEVHKEETRLGLILHIYKTTNFAHFKTFKVCQDLNSICFNDL